MQAQNGENELRNNRRILQHRSVSNIASELLNEEMIDNNANKSNIKKLPLSFMLTNARSLWQKIDCLYDHFTELSLSFAIVTETWFYECEALKTLETNA